MHAVPIPPRTCAALSSFFAARAAAPSDSLCCSATRRGSRWGSLHSRWAASFDSSASSRLTQRDASLPDTCVHNKDAAAKVLLCVNDLAQTDCTRLLAADLVPDTHVEAHLADRSSSSHASTAQQPHPHVLHGVQQRQLAAACAAA